MKQITDVQELRSIQLAALDKIAAFCDANGINYSLSSGTLIGAVRHKGYIPWDDDIDLYMLRSDYERFLDTFKDEDGVYSVVSERMGTSYYYPFAKVVDTRTVVHEDEVEGFDIGVWVDIFPIDYVAEDKKKRNVQFRLNNIFNKMWRCKIDRNNPLRTHSSYLFYKYFPLSATMVQRLRNRLVFNQPQSALVSNLSCMNHRYFPARYMQEFIMLPFEDKQYKAMAAYDEYLTTTYGDYMTLPPEDQRVHHEFRAFWK